MSNGEILQKMIGAFVKGDDKAFREAALDSINEEKRKNHHVLARELEKTLARANGSAGFTSRSLDILPRSGGSLPQDKNRVVDLVEVREADQEIEELVLSSTTHESLLRIIEENRKGELLRTHGMRPVNKLLFYGPPGCGKTTAAEAIAKKLYFPLVLVRFDAVISSYLGDTAANLRQVFEFARRQPMVLFFDEFDAVGKRRDDADEHGELKRVVNSFLQMLDSWSGESVVIAATNHEGMLDPALWRRFDEIVGFLRPDAILMEEVLLRKLRGQKLAPEVDLRAAAIRLSETQDSSHADAERVAYDAIKSAILKRESPLKQETFVDALERTVIRLAAVHNMS